MWQHNVGVNGVLERGMAFTAARVSANFAAILPTPVYNYWSCGKLHIDKFNGNATHLRLMAKGRHFGRACS
eukprot:181429-Amphidinium_carterae.1